MGAIGGWHAGASGAAAWRFGNQAIWCRRAGLDGCRSNSAAWPPSWRTRRLHSCSMTHFCWRSSRLSALLPRARCPSVNLILGSLQGCSPGCESVAEVRHPTWVGTLGSQFVGRSGLRLGSGALCGHRAGRGANLGVSQDWPGGIRGGCRYVEVAPAPAAGFSARRRLWQS